MESRNHIMGDYDFAARFWTELKTHHNIASQGGQNILREWIIVGLSLSRYQRE